MAVMSQEVKDLFEKVPYARLRDGERGCPAECIVGMKFVIDDETLYLSDQSSTRRLTMKRNPRVSVVFWEGHDAFQIHGTATYVNEGERFEELKAKVDAIFAEKERPSRRRAACSFTSTPCTAPLPVLTPASRSHKGKPCTNEARLRVLCAPARCVLRLRTGTARGASCISSGFFRGHQVPAVAIGATVRVKSRRAMLGAQEDRTSASVSMSSDSSICRLCA